MPGIKGTWRTRAAFSAAIGLLALQTACGGQGSAAGSEASTSAPTSASAPTSSPSSAPAPLTAANLVATLQQNGTLPVLDQGTSIAGSDADGNGVRDDIDAWISSLPDTATEKAALTRDAKTIQQALVVDTTQRAAVVSVANAMARATGCEFYQYGAYYEAGSSAPQNMQLITNRIKLLEEYTVNTPTRAAAYEKFNAAMSGGVTNMPRGAATCDQ